MKVASEQQKASATSHTWQGSSNPSGRGLMYRGRPTGCFMLASVTGSGFMPLTTLVGTRSFTGMSSQGKATVDFSVLLRLRLVRVGWRASPATACSRPVVGTLGLYGSANASVRPEGRFSTSSRDCCFMIASFERLACSCCDRNMHASHGSVIVHTHAHASRNKLTLLLINHQTQRTDREL
jgi:hypothetical protein